MATIDELSAALVKADAAGNAADAKVFADEIRRLRAAPAPSTYESRVASIPGAGGDVAPAAVAGEVPMGRRAIQMVRPTVEALGAAGGGALGTPLGPAGMVGGAGLGYGMAKGGLDVLEQSLGYQPRPASTGEALMRGAEDVATGAAFEIGGRVAAPLIGKAIGKVMDMRQLPAQQAAKIAKQSLGQDLPTVLATLRSARPGASVAEITAGIENPTWQALVQRSLERDPQFLRNLNALSDAESLNALTKLAGGATATETRGVAEATKQNINAVTKPMRESALARANLGRYVAEDAALREANDLAVAAASGGQIDPVRFAAQATGAEKALRSAGVKPLEGAPLAQRIASVARNPQFAANDLIEGSVQQIANDISKWTGSGGVIDANALEAIRKNSVNAAIARLRPGMDATSQQNAAAGVLSRVKPFIDDAIEAAGGTGWRDYLTTHAKGMQRVNEKKLVGEALRLWKSDKDGFVRLVQNESPEVVEKFLGKGNYNIAKELSDSTLDTLRDQAKQHIMRAGAKQQASEGQAALRELMRQNVSRLRLPSHLQAWVTNTNKALQVLEDAIGQKTLDVLTRAVKTPQGAADLLATLPGSERLRVAELIQNPNNVQLARNMALRGYRTIENAPGAVAAGVNALSPESENINALAP